MALVERTLELNINFKDRTQGNDALIMNATEFKGSFLYGIPLCSATSGAPLSDSKIEGKIKAVQVYVENLFSIKLFKQYMQENHDFVREEYKNWGYVRANFLVNKIYSLKGKFNERQVLTYPYDWLTIFRQTPNDYNLWRSIYLVPNGHGSPMSIDYFLTYNNTWFNGFYGASMIPFYWNIEYLTGFNHVPEDLINMIGKMSAIQILPVIEMAVAGGGYTFGVASQSLSIDGLSQSTSKANGGNIFQQRIKLYTEEVKEYTEALKLIYSGLTFGVC